MKIFYYSELLDKYFDTEQACLNAEKAHLDAEKGKNLAKDAVETAKENARSVVDIDTVKKVNDDLVSTIEETIKIQREGREKRIAAEQELVQIENRLKEVLLQNTSH